MGPLKRAAIRSAVVAAWLAGAASAVTGQDIELEDVGHQLGGDGGDSVAVVVVEFGDFACSACAQFARDTWPRVRRELVETGRVRWRIVPFPLGFPNGKEAARAAECAGAQGGFWQYHDRLFASQDEWMEERNPRDMLVELGRTVGLDAEGFEVCYREDLGEERTKRARDAARKLGIRATPTFYIDGFKVQGALPWETFLALIEEAERARSG